MGNTVYGSSRGLHTRISPVPKPPMICTRWLTYAMAYVFFSFLCSPRITTRTGIRRATQRMPTRSRTWCLTCEGWIRASAMWNCSIDVRLARGKFGRVRSIDIYEAWGRFGWILWEASSDRLWSAKENSLPRCVHHIECRHGSTWSVRRWIWFVNSR